MKIEYFFTDETTAFRSPVQPDRGKAVVLRFQTAKADDLAVCLVHEQERFPMERVSTTENLAFYEIRIPEVSDTYRYYFEITEKMLGVSPKTLALQPQKFCFTKMGAVRQAQPEDCFEIIPGFQVPEWLQGAVMYQIFVDRFCNGDTGNDVLDGEYLYLNRQPVHQVADWHKPPEALDVCNFYGGDLQGVWNKLDYLQNLGVQVLYLNPIFVSPSNHKYDSQDYDYVDPHFGRIVDDGGELLPEGAVSNAGASRYRKRVTSSKNLTASNRFFADFVQEVHRRGMKVILDGVFNHCGSFHRWLDREGIYRGGKTYHSELGAWHSEDSPYREYFHFTGKLKYESWWGLDTLPKLNYEESEALQQEILRVAAKWVSPPYCVDGWRLDVAADLGHSENFNHKFWERFRQVVKKANPEAVILAEHYGNVKPWLNGREWDTVMNYDAFMEPVSWFLTGVDKHSDHVREELRGDSQTFFASMRRHMKAFSGGSLLGAMNQLDNHDHSRFLTRTNGQCGRLASHGTEAASEGVRYGVLRQAVVMQMTWPGAPTLYYGDETGVCGWTDPDNRRTYPWGQEDWQLIEFYKYVIEIHKRHPALQTGSLVPLLSEQDLLGYGRFQGHDRLVILVNTDSVPRTAVVDVRVMGSADDASYVRVMETEEQGYNVGVIFCQACEGHLTVTLPAVSSMILWEK